MGADLLFFESHAALALCLDRLLKRAQTPTGGGGGTVLLCQPSRKGTMEAFACHPVVTSRFAVEVFSPSELDPEVAAMHQAYLADPTYSPTIHAPSLLRLTRLPVPASAASD